MLSFFAESNYSTPDFRLSREKSFGESSTATTLVQSKPPTKKSKSQSKRGKLKPEVGAKSSRRTVEAVGSMSDIDSIRTEDIESEFRKSLLQNAAIASGEHHDASQRPPLVTPRDVLQIINLSRIFLSPEVLQIAEVGEGEGKAVEGGDPPAQRSSHEDPAIQPQPSQRRHDARSGQATEEVSRRRAGGTQRPGQRQDGGLRVAVPQHHGQAGEEVNSVMFHA